MKRTLSIGLLIASIAVSAPSFAQVSRDEAAIRKIVTEQEEAWNAGSGASYARNVSDGVSFTNLFGMVMYGAPAFTARHKEILSTFFKGTRKRHVVRRIRFVTPDVAIVDIDNEVTRVKAMPPGIATPAGGVLKTQLMEVFVRRAGRWIVEAYHNVDVKTRAEHAQLPSHLRRECLQWVESGHYFERSHTNS